MPKIVRCTDSAGAVYRELVKTNDDMRQDAVMQQLFSLVNSFLLASGPTRKRQLRIATYKVQALQAHILSLSHVPVADSLLKICICKCMSAVLTILQLSRSLPSMGIMNVEVVCSKLALLSTSSVVVICGH